LTVKSTVSSALADHDGSFTSSNWIGQKENSSYLHRFLVL
jgi:hypothetical protein